MGIKIVLGSIFKFDRIFQLKNSEKHRIVIIFGVEFWIPKPKFLGPLKRSVKKFIGKMKSFFKGNQTRLEERIAALEKSKIVSTYLWDPLWYCKTYRYNFTKSQALNYWYKKGWRRGESPSKYLNLDYCKYEFGNMNPILAYTSGYIAFFPDNKNNFKSPNDEERIKEYLEYKNTRTAKSVIYTCITNKYDDLEEIETYKYINKDWDYVCFTDDEEQIEKGQVGIWKILPLQYREDDNQRNNRWHKLHPHILFPEYEESIYLDSNINILTDKLFKDIKEKNKNFVLPVHFARVCIFNEYERVLERQLDNKWVIRRELCKIVASGMPRNYGLTENNILYRRHHDCEVISIMEDWWEMLTKYSRRDQLSLVYILWKHGIESLDDMTIQNARLDYENYYVFDHKKEQ